MTLYWQYECKFLCANSIFTICTEHYMKFRLFAFSIYHFSFHSLIRRLSFSSVHIYTYNIFLYSTNGKWCTSRVLCTRTHTHAHILYIWWQSVEQAGKQVCFLNSIVHWQTRINIYTYRYSHTEACVRSIPTSAHMHRSTHIHICTHEICCKIKR